MSALIGVSQYIAEQSYPKLKQSLKLEKVQILINEANKLNNDWEILNSKLQKRGIYTKFFNEHQKQLKYSKLSPNKVLQKMLNQKERNRNIKEINNILGEIKIWGVNGYRVIVELRETVTGQELIYHIENDTHTISYTLNTEQYLKLLASNNLGFNYSSWESIEKAKQAGFPKIDLLKLNINATDKNLKRIFEENLKDLQPINLKRDALYQYLVDTKAIERQSYWDKENETYYAYHARIAELHSQLSASFAWRRTPEGEIEKPKDGYFFSEIRKKLVDAYIRIYKKEKLDKDTDSFYEVGDSIKDENTLIENKVGNAVVSLKTIHNAIKRIADLKNVNYETIRTEFINLFTKEPKVGMMLTRQIQEGAYKKAVESINELFTIK